MTLYQKLRRSIEQMPRPAYIFLKSVLVMALLLLACSCLLFAFPGKEPGRAHLAVLLLETPAGVLLLGAVGLAVLLDRLDG